MCGHRDSGGLVSDLALGKRCYMLAKYQVGWRAFRATGLVGHRSTLVIESGR